MCPEIGGIFGNRVRVRVCGICWDGNKLLMVNHTGMGPGDFWAPPGGGVEFGDTVEETLVREFAEETGLEVIAQRFMCVCEFVRRPLHAVELFFEVSVKPGSPMKGTDPELPADAQIISSVAFMPFEHIQLLDKDQRHGLFEIFKTEKALKSATGYWKI